MAPNVVQWARFRGVACSRGWQRQLLPAVKRLQGDGLEYVKEVEFLGGAAPKSL